MKGNTVWATVIASLGMMCGLWLLLFENKLSGAEFVTLSLGFSIIGLIIFFAAEVQEFSIAGNGVKLKELRSEAKKMIEDLKQGHVELFRILVKATIEFSGGFGSSSKIESRAEKFIHIYNEVEKMDCIKELKDDLEKSLKIILVAQYNKFSFIHTKSKTIKDEFIDEDQPQYLYIALNDQLIQESYRGRRPEPIFEKEKQDIIQALDMYAKLYVIKNKLHRIK